MISRSKLKRSYFYMNETNEDTTNDKTEHCDDINNMSNKRIRFSYWDTCGPCSSDLQFEYSYSKVKNFLIGLREMNEQETDNNNDISNSILSKLLCPALNIESFFNDVTFDEEEVIMKLMTLTIKVGRNTNEEGRLKTYCNLIMNSNFIKNEFDKFLMTILTEIENVNVIRIVLRFIKVMYESCRQRAYTLFYVEAKHIISIIKTRSDLSLEMLQLIRDIKELGILNYPYNAKQDIFEYDLCLSEDFRQMSISPTVEDLLNMDYGILRSNKVVGAYESVNDYLDVQFRLMREDFIQPLRQGLTQYLNNNHIKTSEIRIYNNVEILPCWPCRRNGIVNYLRINDPSLKNINWTESKRFLHGSFLCLSHDKFQTLFFASIVGRDKKTLSKGLLLVKFENSNFDCSKRYVMLESINLFESYKHVLKKLQNTNEDNLPLKEYIVYGERKISIPKYLHDNWKMKYRIDDKRFYPGSVESCWPKAADLNMDESQFQAFKMALTSKLSIIQGPPGTGKTFLGLKICDTLINSVQRSDPNFGPILIVCYTNHALDQFLEEIVQERITKSIIRIGSRSKSEILKKYQLHNFKTKEKDFQKSRNRNYRKERRCSKKFIHVQATKYVTEICLLKLDNFKFIINEECFEYFQQNDMREWLMGKRLPYFIFQEDIEIKAWLDRFILTELQNPVKTVVKEAVKDLKMKETEEINFDSDSDLEVNFINNQRIIDENDFDKGITRSKLKRAMKDIKVELCCDEDYVGSSLYGELKKYLNKITKRLFQTKLQSKDCMSKEESVEIISPWTLTLNDRWRLYRHWRNEFIKTYELKLHSLKNNYDEITKELNNINFQEDRIIMKSKKIIGMTTTGAARYGTVLDRVKCKIIIIEEAAEVIESHVIASLSKDCEHLILIGDHKQLKPKPASYDLSKKHQLDCSLFERLINNNLPFNVLQLQHRMRPEIASIMKNIYENLENHESVLSYPNVPGVANNLFFLDHNQPEVLKKEMMSYSNKFEAEFIMGFCRRLLDNGITNSKITILTLYTGQMSLLRKVLCENRIENVRICVVDNYQGEENDVILLSLVRSNEEDKIGFVKTENRICVSLSRARHGLFVFGNFTILSRQSNLWRNICKDLQKKNLLDNKMILSCQRHSFKRLQIFNPNDFKKYPGGGCDEICNTKLSCGHICKQSCHVKDMNHIKSKCHGKCMKKCKNEHNCNLECWEDCKPCITPMSKTIPDCNHAQIMACHVIPSRKMCSVKCEKLLLCGHKCQKLCGQDCDGCDFQLTKICSECGFSYKQNCNVNSTCKRLCNMKLPCGHTCGGNCFVCNNQRLHIQCKKFLTTLLVCGHTKINLCFEQTNYCDSSCEQSCLHSRCRKECGECCEDCLEDCLWKCDHFICTKDCYQFCNRPICDARCNKLIICNVCSSKFKCYGICGEICRNMCRQCDPRIDELFGKHGKKVKIITFITCGHSFECGEIDDYMNAPYVKEKIETKRCPACKKLITVESCFRYSNIVKMIFLDVKRVQSFFNDDQQMNLFEDFRNYYAEKRIELYKLFAELNLRNFFSTIEEREGRKLTNIETRKCLISFKIILDIHKYFFPFITHEKEFKNYEYIRKMIEYLLGWLDPFKRSFNNFELNQFYSEFDRIHLLVQLSSEKIYKRLPNDAPNIIKDLQKISNFSGLTATELVDKILFCINFKNDYYLMDKLNLISFRDLNEITEMGVRCGDWHKCRKGHYYIQEWTSVSAQCKTCHISTSH